MTLQMLYLIFFISLTQAMACCLMAPSHYLIPCWLISSKVLMNMSQSMPLMSLLWPKVMPHSYIKSHSICLIGHLWLEGTFNNHCWSHITFSPFNWRWKNLNGGEKRACQPFCVIFYEKKRIINKHGRSLIIQGFSKEQLFYLALFCQSALCLCLLMA